QEPTNLGSILDIAAGNGFTCAVRQGNTVACWGANYARQLGRDDLDFSWTFVAVSGLSGAEAITAGSSHGCVRLADRTMRCWGSGGEGQLGHGEFLPYDGDTGSSATPVTPSGLGGVVGMSLGNNVSCAATALGNIYCWGANSFGQLGDHQLSGQTPTSRRRPFAVPTIGPITSEAGLCTDNLDNDVDGNIDCADSDCATSLGSSTGEAVVTGTTCDSGNYFSGTCRDPSSRPAPEVVHTWTAPEAGTYDFSTTGSALETTLYILGETCIGARLACETSTWNTRASLVRAVDQGDKLVIIVDGPGQQGGGAGEYGPPCGDYQLNITKLSD
ncbi:MAG: hypothetical protein ACNA8W_22240, partial [Bradymonadaceae bacterium]